MSKGFIEMYKQVIILVLVLLLPGSAYGQVSFRQHAKVAVVNKINPVKNLSSDQVRKYFMGNDTFWGGVVKVTLFIGKSDSSSSEALEQVSNVSISELEERWTKRVLAGQGRRPKSFSSVSDLAKKVGASPGGIAIIKGSQVSSLLSDANSKKIKLIEVK